jgi:cell division protein FtsB
MDHRIVNKHKQHTNPEDVFWSVLKTAILGIVCVILVFSVYKMYKKYHKTTKALADARSELTKLQHNKESVETAIQRLSTSEGREYEIRDRWRVTKSGEKMIVVIDNSADRPKYDISDGIFVKFKEWLYNL